MSWFMAAVYDRVMAKAEADCLTEWRKALLAQAHGTVLELGSGTGVNLPLYPQKVSRLVCTEPDPHMRRQLQRRVTASALRQVDILDARAESLPFADETFDSVVSTLVLCSVTDLHACLREAHRVLKPHGTLVFLEHVLADANEKRMKWQRRLEPVWRCLADGCHLTRATGTVIAASGFTLESIEHASMRKAPTFIRPTIRGYAKKA